MVLSEYLIYLILGFLCSVLLVGFVFSLKTALIEKFSLDEFLHKLELPLAGEIPSVDLLAKTTPAANSFTIQNALADQYLTVAKRLPIFQQAGKPQVLLVTGSKTGEGCSTVAANLANSYAKLGAKVLLIDANASRPRIHYLFNLPNQWGLTHYLVGACQLAKVTQRYSTETHGLYVMSAGDPARDALHLFSGRVMRQLLESARQHFDVTILDSPSVSEGAEALVLASLANATLLVSSVKLWQHKNLAAAVDQLERVTPNIVGVLKMDAKQGALEDYFEQQQREALKRVNARGGGLNLLRRHANLPKLKR